MTFHVRAFTPSDPTRDFRFTFPEEIVPEFEAKAEKADIRRLDAPVDSSYRESWQVTLKWRRTRETLPFEQGMFTGTWNRNDDVIIVESDLMVVGFPNLCPTFSTYFEYVRNPQGQLHLFKEIEMAKIEWSGVWRGVQLVKHLYDTVADPDPMIQYSQEVLKGLGLEECNS